MTRLTFGLCWMVLCLSQILHAQERPKLVVMVVVDQMRADYLDRFMPIFSPYGFKRLINSGFAYRNTKYAYLPTYTGPGHASIATGSIPAVHGIVANDWWERKEKREVYCVEDTQAKAVGLPVAAGKMSPHRLLATTLGHQVKLTLPGSKSLAIALKDRAAILSAGHKADGVYWMEDSLGYFITSDFYAKQLPAWVVQFNQSKPAEQALKEDWTLLLGPEAYAAVGCEPDDSPYESTFKGESKPVFPHRISQIRKQYNAGLLKSLPAGNTLTLQMARAAVLGESLGKRGVTDFLTISFSSTDYLGHKMGIRSVELADMYARLDRDLGAFFQFLDQEVGANAWTLVLTADHGAAENPGFMAAQGVPAEAIGYQWVETFNKDFQERMGIRPIGYFNNLQVHFDEQQLNYTGIRAEDVRDKVRQFVAGLPFVAHVYSADEVRTAANVLPWLSMLARAYFPARSGDLFLIPSPGHVEMAWQKTGTSHGAAYPFDTKVPFVLYGVGVNQGESYTACGVEDIAVTLAEMLRVSWPNGAVGEPRMEHWQKPETR